MVTNVKGRRFSPSMATIASVSLVMISFFWAGVNYFLDQFYLNQWHLFFLLQSIWLT